MHRFRGVRGAKGPACEGNYCYVDSSGNATLIGDNRDGPAQWIVVRFIQEDVYDIRDITDLELVIWQRKWGASE